MKSILLVDDNVELLRGMKAILASEGYEVQTAENGRKGLAVIETTKFDLLITDIIMPEQEGVEMIFSLRKSHPSLPIIAMSGGGQIYADNHLVLAKKMGAAATLEKPFSPEELVSTVRMTLSRACKDANERETE